MPGPATTSSTDDGVEVSSTSTRALTALIGTRLVGNIFHRFPYVLLTPLSAGLGISVATATSVLGLRELGGVAAPAIGRWADRGHERRAMTWCCTLTGALAVLIWLGNWIGTPLWLFTSMMIVGGLTKIGIDTSQSAWIAHRVPFARRGRILGLTEVAWGGAFLLGVPICAWLTDRWGWRAPFGAIGFALLAGAIWIRVVTPHDEPEAVDEEQEAWHRWRPPVGSGGLFAFATLQPFAQMLVFAVAGDWFVQSLGMSLTGLGLNTMLLGIGEVAGTLGSAWSADRFGKRTAALTGVLIIVPTCAAMGLVGHRAVFGVALLVVAAVGFELSWVSALPLFTEIAPDTRAATLGAFFAVATVSRAVSSAAAGWIYTAGGIAAVGVVAASIATVLAVALRVAVAEPDRHPRPA